MSESRAPTRVRRMSGPDQPHLPLPQEPQIEGCEHQHDADVHEQPFHESMSEEQDIQTHDNDDHGHNEEHANDRSCHSPPPRLRILPPTGLLERR